MITSNTQFSAVSGALSDLKGERISIQDIIDTVLQINNMKSKTLAKMKSNACYNPSEVGVVPLKSLYVDMTYQRIIRLQKLINKLRKLEGYDMYSAGVVDVAIDDVGHLIAIDSLPTFVGGTNQQPEVVTIGLKPSGKLSFAWHLPLEATLHGLLQRALPHTRGKPPTMPRAVPPRWQIARSRMPVAFEGVTGGIDAPQHGALQSRIEPTGRLTGVRWNDRQSLDQPPPCLCCL